MSDRDIPGDVLAADAALAVEHTPEREAEQWAHLGGEKDDIDDFDATDLDDGSVLPEDYDETAAPAESPSDEATEDEEPSDEVSDDDEPAVEAEESDNEVAEEEEADEADAGEDSEGEDEDAPAQRGIPKWRFDEINEEKKALREEVAALKAQAAAGKPPTEDEPEPYDIRANTKEYMDLLLDGDVDGALAKMEEIDAAKEAKWKSETQTATVTDLNTNAEASELLALSQEAESMFGQFNPDHADYNQGMLNKVMTFMRGYESSGEMSRSDAFVAGLADVVEMYDLMPEEAGDENPEPKPKPKPKTVDKTAVRKQAHTPVAGEGSGSADAGAVAPSIDDMTDEELDALPEKTLARMRGDIL